MKPWMDDKGIEQLDLSLRPYNAQLWIIDHWFHVPDTIWAYSLDEAYTKIYKRYYAWVSKDIIVTAIETDRPHEHAKSKEELEPPN